MRKADHFWEKAEHKDSLGSVRRRVELRLEHRGGKEVAAACNGRSWLY